MKKANILFVIIFSMMPLFFLNCGANMYSDADDVKLGAQVNDEIHKDPKQYPILQGHADIQQYVTGVVNKVLASPAITKKGVYPYSVQIIHDDSTINAFCTPGGYIFVYTGLMKFIDNEATLAGVLGHEIAHAELRHSTQRMTSAYGAQAVLGLVLGTDPNMAASVAANLFTGLALLKNSRDDEAQADEYSLKYLSATEYYPGAIQYFFNKIQKQGGSSNSDLARFLSDHPLDQDRIDHTNQILQSMGNPKPTDANTFPARFKAIQKKLP